MIPNNAELYWYRSVTVFGKRKRSLVRPVIKNTVLNKYPTHIYHLLCIEANITKSIIVIKDTRLIVQ